MGYTHYFPQMKKIKAGTFKKIAMDIQTLIESGDERVAPLANGLGDEGTKPEIILGGREAKVWFNGIEEDAHETFALNRQDERRGYEGPDLPYGFTFTKTARKPYDTIVCAALLLCHYHAPGWRNIGSDGSPEELNPYECPNGWTAARQLIIDVLGYDDVLYPPGIVPDPEEVDRDRLQAKRNEMIGEMQDRLGLTFIEAMKAAPSIDEIRALEEAG